MTVKILRENLHFKILNLRSIERILHTESFETIYSQASDIEKKSVSDVIDKCDKLLLDQWIKKEIKNASMLEELSMKDLREMAKNLKVPDYSMISKSSLLSEILRRKDE